MVNRVRQLVILSILSMSAQIVSGQSSALLFQTKEPLHILADTKIKYIKKNLNDSSCTALKIYYEKAPGVWDSLDVGVQLHGHLAT